MKKIQYVKKILQLIGTISFCMLMCVVEGMEYDQISTLNGAVYSMVFLVLFSLSVTGANLVGELYVNINKI